MMMEPRMHEEALDFVTGALSVDEAEAFERRLAADPALASEVRALREALGALATALPPVAPPSGLRDRILSRAREEAPPVSTPAPAPAPSPRVTLGRPTQRGPDRRERRSGLAPWVPMAAGVVLAFVGLAGYLSERSERQALQDELRTSQGETTRLAGEAARLDSLLSVLADPGVRVATMASTGQPPSGRLHWDPSSGRAVLVVAGLEPAPDGRTYQAWGIADGQDPVSLGTFNTGPDGRGVITLSGPIGQEFALGAVTNEPAGGSPGPTSTPFLVGDLTAG